MNDPIQFDFSTYDEREKREQEEQTIREATAAREAMEAQEETATAAPEPVTKETEQKEEPEEKTGVLANLDKFVEEETSRFESQREEGFTTDNMSGRQRVVAGTIDTIMDLTSKFIPGMQKPADWWDEVSGRKAPSDPLKKAERDLAAIIGPMFIGGGAIGAGTKAAGLAGKTKLMTDATLGLGLDALITGTSDTTSEAGNLSSLLETQLQKILPNATIPLASRDSDSPDTIYDKNFIESMLLGGLDPIITGVTAARAGNKIVAKNDVAQAIVDTIPEKPSTIQDAITRNRAKKRDEQLKIGRRVLDADPEGVNGYNAFVNEPAEASARTTLDETGNTVEFMADQARIQNNVGTLNGRARPLLDNDTQELLSRADSATRAKAMKKVAEELGSKFELTVGGNKLNAKQVTEAVNNLYDAAIAPIGKSFDDAVKGFRDLELSVGTMTDTVSGRGGRQIMGKTIDRLVNALSPQTQRASAAVQTQTAAGASDLARAADLDEPVVDTSRLQELMMPRLRVLLKEQATSQVAESMSTTLQKKLAKQTETIEGTLELDDKYFNDMFDAYTQAVEEKAQLIDDFVDELTEMAKENPSYLRPVYRLYAKTNGEVDSMYKLNQYLSNRLGILRKGLVDQNPEVSSLILKEMQAVRTANMINGTAPATAWIGNLSAVALRPLTTLAGSVPIGVATGNWKNLQRSLVAFGQVQETFRRASKMARDEWKFVTSNPEAAMARGRADYDFTDANADAARTLADYKEMEELSETFSPGRKALWNMTKQFDKWNKANFNRWGVNAMYSADGFVKSMMASMNSRFQAYDQAVSATNGVLDKAKFVELEKKFYNEAFDADGMIKEGYAKFASEEIALNADNKLVSALENAMDQFPIMKSIFMFPRTKANAISIVQTFDPTGATALWSDKSWKTLTANAGDQRAVNEILEMHGMKGGSMDDFRMLQSEYLGRKMTTSGVVATGAMITVGGNMTGSGAWMSPAEKQRALQGGWKPYTLYGKSYEKAPDWMKLALSLTSDITMAHFGPDAKAAEDWFAAMRDVLAANVGNEMFGSEVESLSELLNMGPGNIARYLSGLTDTMIPGAGVRSALNDVLVPQLMDVENNFQSYLANRNRWITHPLLEEAVDPFTGGQINGAKYPLERFIGRMLPFWESAGGDEDWRKWMMSTGWTGLSKPMVNPVSGEKLGPNERQWINRWIGENRDWDKDMERVMKMDDGQMMKDLRRLGGKRALLDLGDTKVHTLLDLYKKKHFDDAWTAYVYSHPEVIDQSRIKALQKQQTYQGDYGAAVEAAEVLQMYK